MFFLLILIVLATLTLLSHYYRDANADEEDDDDDDYAHNHNHHHHHNGVGVGEDPCVKAILSNEQQQQHQLQQQHRSPKAPERYLCLFTPVPLPPVSTFSSFSSLLKSGGNDNCDLELNRASHDRQSKPTMNSAQQQLNQSQKADQNSPQNGLNGNSTTRPADPRPARPRQAIDDDDDEPDNDNYDVMLNVDEQDDNCDRDDAVDHQDHPLDNHCLLCNVTFNLLAHKRFVCRVCALAVCRACSLFDDPHWICNVCDQQRTISNRTKCQSWLCKRIQSVSDKELIHFVNAKMRFESTRQRRPTKSNTSAESTDSSSTLPLAHPDGKQQPQHQQHDQQNGNDANRLEHLIALRSDIELIVVKLLGIESIDYAHVGLLFHDPQYSELVDAYTETLASLLATLQDSIFASQSGKQFSVAPTDAYHQLKTLLGELSEKSFRLTPLRPNFVLELEKYLAEFGRCHTYQHLLANSIVNQIVEVSQTRFFGSVITTTAATLVPSIASSSALSFSSSSSSASPSLSLSSTSSSSSGSSSSASLNRLHRRRQHHHHHNHNHPRHYRDHVGQSTANNSLICGDKSNRHGVPVSSSVISESGRAAAAASAAPSTDDMTTNVENHPIEAAAAVVVAAVEHDFDDVDDIAFDADADEVDHIAESDSTFDTFRGYASDLDRCDQEYREKRRRQRHHHHQHQQQQPHHKKHISGGRRNLSYDSDLDTMISTDENDDDDHHHHHYEDEDDYRIRYDSFDSFDDINFDFESTRATIFPEAGFDLIDSISEKRNLTPESPDSGVKRIDGATSWQDNWLFKKHKDNRQYCQYHLNSDIHYGYMALALSESVPMLIPNPSGSDCAIDSAISTPLIGDIELDACSDLSERDDTGDSVDSIADLFSDDDDENCENDENFEIEFKNKNKSTNSIDKTAPISRITPKKQRILGAAAAANSSAPFLRRRSARWSAKLKIPDFVAPELRNICSSMPDSRQTNLDAVPCIALKPGNASVHTGVVAQFCCKARGRKPLHFAWYKDGTLIACSDSNHHQRRGPASGPGAGSVLATADSTRESNEESKRRHLAQLYFGIRFEHRRVIQADLATAESNLAAAAPGYRLIVFNANECVLEVKRCSPSHTGVYSVVAYNHAGYDWTDFSLSVDRSHYSAAAAKTAPSFGTLAGAISSPSSSSLSPRPVRRRPQNKPRKSLIYRVIEQQQLAIINYLVKAVNEKRSSSTLAATNPLQRRDKRSPTHSQPIDNNNGDGPQHQTIIWHADNEDDDDDKYHADNAHNHTKSGVSVADDNDNYDQGDRDDDDNDGDDKKRKFAKIPNFTQRTWKEREKEEEKKYQNQQNDGYQKRSNDSELSEPRIASQTVVDEEVMPAISDQIDNDDDHRDRSDQPANMSIADREHQKWLHPDVQLANNPYSAESIELRVRQSQQLLENSNNFSSAHNDEDDEDDKVDSSDENESDENGEDEVDSANENKSPDDDDDDEDFDDEEMSEDGFEKKKFFSDRDITRYKRDYYLPKNNPNADGSLVYSILDTLGGASSGSFSSMSGARAKSRKNKKKKKNQKSNQKIKNQQEQESTQREEVAANPPIESMPEKQQIVTETNGITSSSSSASIDHPISSPASPSLPLIKEKDKIVEEKEEEEGEVEKVIDNPIIICDSISAKPTVIGAETKPLSSSTTTTTTLNPIDSSNYRASSIAENPRRRSSSPSFTLSASSSSSLSSLSAAANLDLSRTPKLKDQVLAKLPSVKNLVNLFSSSSSPSSPSSAATSGPVSSTSTATNFAAKSPPTSLTISTNNNTSNNNNNNNDNEKAKVQPAKKQSANGSIANGKNIQNATNNTSNNNMTKNYLTTGLGNNNFKVHSLTARSMPREYREQMQAQLPRNATRIDRTIHSTNGHNNNNNNNNNNNSSSRNNPKIMEPVCEAAAAANTNHTSLDHSESLTSDDSNFASTNIENDGNDNDNIIGQEDELNDSAEANNKRSSSSKQNGHPYRPILERAQFWQKRMENGLISDQAVKASFPAMAHNCGPH